MFADYEELILASQEDDNDMVDECVNCPVRGADTCDNRCQKVVCKHFDMQLMRYVEDKKVR